MRSPSLRWNAVLLLTLGAAASQACGGGSDETSSTTEGAGGSAASGASGKAGSQASGASGSGGQTAGKGGTSGAGGAGAAGKAGASGASGAGQAGQAGQAGAAGKSGAAGAGAAGSSGAAGSAAGTAGASGASAGSAGASGTAGAAGSTAGAAGTAGSAGKANVFEVTPVPLQTITVPINQSAPTVAYSATLNGQPVNAGWSVSKGNIGSIAPGPSAMGTFIPTGKTGGVVDVLAGLNGQTLKRQVMVKLTGSQNGVDPMSPVQLGQVPATPADLTAGGGVGGVGGEGLGTPVPMGQLPPLGMPGSNGAAEGLKLLYPYDNTVFPRGILAPLLQWDWSIGDADAISIKLETTSGSFTWVGTFAKPAILTQTGQPFRRHPIPQDIWQIATDTAGGATPDGTPDKLKVSLVVEKNGMGYGPITETWTVAPGRLSGIIYYNSYGTNLAKNYPGAVGGDHTFGGAVLSIHVGDTGPKLVAGANGGVDQCRVCHSVSAKGSSLVVQHGDSYGVSSSYDLLPNGSVEHVLATGATFPALAPDGNSLLSPSGQIVPLPTGAPVVPTGLSSVATSLGTPSFSPDGKKAVFNPMAGGGAPPTRSLVAMDFDAATNTFSNAAVVADDSAQPAGVRPGWPAFFPDGSSVVYERQTTPGTDPQDGALYTRRGAKGLIAWTGTTAPNVTILNLLNGLDPQGNSYLPKLPAPKAMSCTADGEQVGNKDADHGDDVHLNYEPTVNPVAAGGYAWVVFTSRRMYGSVADIPPYCSDPRGVDLVQNVTPKKLWVAAIDLNAAPGSDASHPAFYLPGQELLAGNARGFWVLDPCRADGVSCESGDQCCNGYCQPGSGGSLQCTNTPPNNMCSGLSEKCTTAADCCDPKNACVGGFCAQSKP